MREYYLFLVKESVAVEFAGKEHKIYSLLLDSFQDDIARKQVEYITHHIPAMIDTIIGDTLGENESYSFMNQMHQLILEDGQAKLQTSKNFVFLQSIGNNQIETYFFEVLRRWKRSFFAVEKNQGTYGWLTPIKKSAVRSILESSRITSRNLQ